MGLLLQPDAFSKIPKEEYNRLMQKIDWLWNNRTIVNHLTLSENLSGFYKKRVGKYRIIYTYDANPDNMIIYVVGHRDDIYKKFK